MDIVIGIIFLAIVTFAFLASSGHRRAYRVRSRLGSAARTFRKFNADNVALWEDFLRAQRPWETSRR